MQWSCWAALFSHFFRFSWHEPRFYTWHKDISYSEQTLLKQWQSSEYSETELIEQIDCRINDHCWSQIISERKEKQSNWLNRNTIDSLVSAQWAFPALLLKRTEGQVQCITFVPTVEVFLSNEDPGIAVRLHSCCVDDHRDRPNGMTGAFLVPQVHVTSSCPLA